MARTAFDGPGIHYELICCYSVQYVGVYYRLYCTYTWLPILRTLIIVMCFWRLQCSLWSKSKGIFYSNQTSNANCQSGQRESFVTNTYHNLLVDSLISRYELFLNCQAELVIFITLIVYQSRGRHLPKWIWNECSSEMNLNLVLL